MSTKNNIAAAAAMLQLAENRIAEQFVFLGEILPP